MKSTLTLLLCALLTAYTGRAATNVSGIITTNTTWTKANSPYMVTANIAIDSNVTLTIEPGVEVQCAGNVTIYCDGNIIAAGTFADPIVFTSSITGTHTVFDWKGIELSGKTPGAKSLFHNCTAAYAQNTIAITNAPVTIDSCLFHDCYFAVRAYTGNARVYIRFNTITHCSYPIALGDMAFSAVSSNKLSYGDLGISVNMGDSTYIGFNTIGHFNIGMDITQKGDLPCQIRNNIVYSCAGIGLQVDHTDPTAAGNNQYIMSNVFRYNNIGMYMSGIHSDVYHNTFTNNNTGIRHRDNNPNMDFLRNCIFDNVVNLEYNGTADINNFTNNYWGSTDSATIAGTITDYWDNPLYGRVGFVPFNTMLDTLCYMADTTVPQTGIAYNIKAAPQLKLYPNPATEKLTIELPANTHAQISISNMTGAVIYRGEHSGGKQNINTANWPAGIYLVRCLGADGMNETLKLEKQ